MVGRQDGRRGHQRRHHGADGAHRERAGGRDQGEADQEVPTHVQARHGGVLVDEGGRLQHPVGTGLVGDCVDHAHVCEPGGSDRIGRVDAQAQQAGHEHRVPQPTEHRSVVHRQPDQRCDDHRPVTPDVDPVGQRGQRLLGDERGLHTPLDVEPERLLHGQDVSGMTQRGLGRAGGLSAHPEVEGDAQHDGEGVDQHGANDDPRRGHGHLLHEGSRRVCTREGSRPSSFRATPRPPPEAAGGAGGSGGGRAPSALRAAGSHHRAAGPAARRASP